MARLPPPRHDVHRRLWVSDCRAGDDSPLSKPFRQDVPETCRSQRLSTPRRRRCGPNAMSRTRSPPCAAASSPPSSKRCRDAHAAQHRSSDDHDRKICDAVRLGACPSSRCSSLSESDSTLDYEQALPPLEYRSDVASAAECAGLRSQGPCLAVYRRAGAGEPGFQGDRGQLREWARPAAVRSAHDGRVAAARLCEWALFVAADCQSLPRAERFRDDCRARSAGLPNDQRLPQAAFKGARRVVSAGSEVVRGSRAGQTRPRRLGWHEDQSERVET